MDSASSDLRHISDIDLPIDLAPRLRSQLEFLIEIDALKTVLRQSPLAAVARRENDAEHSWHLVVMVVILAEYADEPLDVGHAAVLAAMHDLVELYAGDTPVYDPTGVETQQEREKAAADRLFAMLPDGQAASVRLLWEEFEACATPEARFAKAMDRLEPLLLNWVAHGGTWQTPGVTADGVRRLQSLIGNSSQELWHAARSLIGEAEERGWLRPGSKPRC